MENHSWLAPLRFRPKRRIKEDGDVDIMLDIADPAIVVPSLTAFEPTTRRQTRGHTEAQRRTS